MILGLTWGALQVQITLAGFLNGESIWSKAQKQAVVDLDGYASNGNPSDLEHFRRNFAILQADAAARDAIASGDYDVRKVTRDFQDGSVIPQAIPGMIFILDHFRSAPHMREALHAWYSVNPQIAELGSIATRLQAMYATAAPLPPAEVARMRQRIRQLNQSIEPQASEFSLEIARGAAWVGRILFLSVLGAAIAALLLWLLMARRVLAGIRGSEERYRLLFDSAPDAIVMVDEISGRVVDANRSARNWTGHDRKSLIGTRYEDLFEHGISRRGASGSGELRGRDGNARPVETQTNTVVWGDRLVRQAIIRDISERVEGDRARRIAAEALASISEGVIITDAKRNVLSLNAAATKMTGFRQEKLAGRRLENTRTLADGSLLPPTIWDEVIAVGHWSGEVVSHRADGSTYPEALRISTIRDAELRVLYYVAVFNDVTVANAARRRLEQLASQDTLTGLANRASFEHDCEAAIERARDRHAAAVMFIDLDAFKFVNDSYSHAVGDHLLRLVAERITRQLRDGDIAGRIGGDEFTVLLPQLGLREDAAALATRMLSTLSEPFRVDEYEIVVSASIGIAGFPLDGEDAKTLIANADAAMYAAKSEERNAWRFYVPTMRADSRRRMLLATELRKALQQSEFRLAFQPSVEMDSGRILGAEALLRWEHPDRGEVMPGEFIPVAEGIGLIHRIDEWVMHAVCEQIHEWNQTGVPQVRVAINVSARWFAHPGFVQSLRHALQVNAVEPERIVLEITEGAMLGLGEETRNTMRALEELGVAVAIDDFGTGYASMAYLKLPAVKHLKIDRSFIMGLPDSADDAAITIAMVAMAKSLGLTTIAEGIETEAQHEFMQRAGCEQGQGYLYAYPLQPKEFERMLRPKHPPGGARLKLVRAVRS
ncbi:MAG TPA: EAL domain-containing protein [Rhodanobacteraceae bacterium]|nr:EAL domain-containing protein [Rhodanobacteraceae bacterium]